LLYFVASFDHKLNQYQISLERGSGRVYIVYQISSLELVAVFHFQVLALLLVKDKLGFFDFENVKKRRLVENLY